MELKTKYEKKCKLKKGDEVIVIAGKAKGTQGKIDRINLKKDSVYIGGVNTFKRRTKPSLQHPEGGIVDKVMPIHISNVALVDPKTKKATRVGYKVEAGKKVRFAKASGTILS